MDLISVSYSGSDNECNVVAPEPEAIVFDAKKSVIKSIVPNPNQPAVPVYTLPSDLKHCGCEVNRVFSSYSEVYRFVSQNLKDIAESAKCQNQVRVFLSIKCEAPLVPREALISPQPPPLPVPLPSCPASTSGHVSNVDYAPASDQHVLASTADIPMPMAPPMETIPNPPPPPMHGAYPHPPVLSVDVVPDSQAEGSGEEQSDVSAGYFLDAKVVEAFDRAEAAVDKERIVVVEEAPPPPPPPEKPARVKQVLQKRKRLSSQEKLDRVHEEERLEGEGWGKADKPRKELDQKAQRAFAEAIIEYFCEPKWKPEELRFEDIPISELGMRLERRQRILKEAEDPRMVRTNYLVKELRMRTNWLVKRYAILDAGKKNPARHEQTIGNLLSDRYRRDADYAESLSSVNEASLNAISHEGQMAPVLPQSGYFEVDGKHGYCFGPYVKLYSLKDLESENSKKLLPDRFLTLRGCRDLLSVWAVCHIFEHGDLNENQIYWLPEEERFVLGDFSHSHLLLNGGPGAVFHHSPCQPAAPRDESEPAHLLNLFADCKTLLKKDRTYLRSLAREASQWQMQQDGLWYGVHRIEDYVRTQLADNNSAASALALTDRESQGQSQ